MKEKQGKRKKNIEKLGKCRYRQKYTLEQLGHNYMYTEKLGTNAWTKLKHFSLSRHKLCDKNNGVSFYRIVGDSCTCYKQSYILNSDLQVLLEVESCHSLSSTWYI